jgi:hypothetical protein
LSAALQSPSAADSAGCSTLRIGLFGDCDGLLPTEDKAQYQELLEQLREDRQPQGALEELWVEKIAICFWRLRRILRYDFENNQGSGRQLAPGHSGVIDDWAWVAPKEAKPSGPADSERMDTLLGYETTSHTRPGRARPS